MASHVELQVQWLPRTANQKADYLSRIVDADDWAFGHKYFQILNTTWGPFSIDRFAADYNSHLARFNSRFWSPGTEAVDAFSQDWSSDNNWLCPPVFLIPRTIHKLRHCNARGTLIVPEWPSATFWPLISPGLGVFAPFVCSVKYFSPAPDLFQPGRSQQIVYKNTCSVFCGTHNFRMLALRLDFSLEAQVS